MTIKVFCTSNIAQSDIVAMVKNNVVERNSKEIVHIAFFE